jgi:hypothetical protein
MSKARVGQVSPHGEEAAKERSQKLKALTRID